MWRYRNLRLHLRDALRIVNIFDMNIQRKASDINIKLIGSGFNLLRKQFRETACNTRFAQFNVAFNHRDSRSDLQERIIPASLRADWSAFVWKDVRTTWEDVGLWVSGEECHTGD